MALVLERAAGEADTIRRAAHDHLAALSRPAIGAVALAQRAADLACADHVAHEARLAVVARGARVAVTFGPRAPRATAVRDVLTARRIGEQEAVQSLKASVGRGSHRIAIRGASPVGRQAALAFDLIDARAPAADSARALGIGGTERETYADVAAETAVIETLCPGHADVVAAATTAGGGRAPWNADALLVVAVDETGLSRGAGRGGRRVASREGHRPSRAPPALAAGPLPAPAAPGS